MNFKPIENRCDIPHSSSRRGLKDLVYGHSSLSAHNISEPVAHVNAFRNQNHLRKLSSEELAKPTFDPTYTMKNLKELDCAPQKCKASFELSI